MVDDARPRLWLPAAPERTNFAGVPVEPSTAHVTPEPEPAGSGSLRFAVVVSASPVFLTSTVKPIWSPAFTGEASAVFVIVTCATGMWNVVQTSPTSPPPEVWFWSVSWVMLCTRYVWPGWTATNVLVVGSNAFRPGTFHVISAP